jgi:hypothetical protein
LEGKGNGNGSHDPRRESLRVSLVNGFSDTFIKKAGFRQQEIDDMRRELQATH